MNLISCVDDGLGLRFNHRRQSRDKMLAQHILRRTGGEIWLHPDSKKLFDECPDAMLHVISDPEEVPEGAWCFWESPVSPALRPEKILLYHWNRVYPADELFVYPGGQDQWECPESTDFSGFSHPKITEEVLIPREVPNGEA